MPGDRKSDATDSYPRWLGMLPYDHEHARLMAAYLRLHGWTCNFADDDSTPTPRED